MRHYWHRGMRWMGRPWRWGYHRRPCCCLFFALPLMLVPFLAVVALLLHFVGCFSDQWHLWTTSTNVYGTPPSCGKGMQ
jgi:hypothetical protein